MDLDEKHIEGTSIYERVRSGVSLIEFKDRRALGVVLRSTE